MSQVISGARARKEKPEVSVVIPTFNESLIIGDRVTEISQILKRKKIPHEILVVDDGSFDLTGAVAKEYGATVISFLKSHGKGYATRRGVSLAKGDIIVTIDADGYNPRDLEKLIESVKNGADIVVASRISKASNIRPYALRKRSKLATLLFNLLFVLLTGKFVSDSLTSFRAYRKGVFNQLNPASDGFELASEITYKALSRNLIYKELPITFNVRDTTRFDGRSFFDGLRILKNILMLLLIR